MLPSPYAVCVVVLTGGRSTRMGEHKPSLEVGGRPMVRRVLEAARPRATLVVGRSDDVPDGIPTVVEQPPGGGPVAALAAAVEHLPTPTDVVVVLAADLPFVTSAHLDRLVGAVTAAAANGLAVTVDAAGRLNWLCSAWRTTALRAALSALGDPAGHSMRALAAATPRADVADVDAVADDVDTPADLRRARHRSGAGEPTP